MKGKLHYNTFGGSPAQMRRLGGARRVRKEDLVRMQRKWEPT